MPNENPTPKKKSRNERTEAKFLEDVDRLIAEAERLGADYMPPNADAAATAMQTKRDAVLAQRTVYQQKVAATESKRNQREMLYKSLRSDVASLVEYAKSAGASKNDIEALKSIQREMTGRRAEPTGEGEVRNSVSHQSYATLADTYSRFIEQYEMLGINSTEDMYKTATHRTRLNALRQANTDVIQAEADENDAGETLDRLVYTDADSLIKSCISGKAYIRSKYKTTGEPYRNIAKTRFIMPSRLRR